MSELLKSDKITTELLKHIRLNKAFIIWMGFLGISLLVCIYAYTIQLRDGLGVAGIRDYVSWGLYIANFVFFVAVSLIGMLMSAVLGLLDTDWSKPLARIAEIIALAFASVSGLVIISDMGRPDRLLNVIYFWSSAITYSLGHHSGNYLHINQCFTIIFTINSRFENLF